MFNLGSAANMVVITTGVIIASYGEVKGPAHHHMHCAWGACHIAKPRAESKHASEFPGLSAAVCLHLVTTASHWRAGQLCGHRRRRAGGGDPGRGNPPDAGAGVCQSSVHICYVNSPPQHAGAGLLLCGRTLLNIRAIESANSALQMQPYRKPAMQPEPRHCLILLQGSPHLM